MMKEIMKASIAKIPVTLGIIICLIAVSLFSFSCGSSAALVINKGDNEVSLSLAEIKALPVNEGISYWMSHTGEVHGPYRIKDVFLRVYAIA